MTRALALMLLATPAHAGAQAVVDAAVGLGVGILIIFVGVVLFGDDVRKYVAWLLFSAIVALGCLLALPAKAGDTAPGSHLWPPEPAYAVSVFEVTCTDLGDCCGVHRACGDWHQRQPDPAPVPLPFSGLLLAAACGLLRRMRA